MSHTLFLVWDYSWRFALYGVVMGGLFGAAFGWWFASGSPEPQAGAAIAGTLGAGFGLAMGIGTGIFLALVARIFFYERITSLYRPVMLGGAFIAAFVIGVTAIQLTLFGISGSPSWDSDWGIVLILAGVGGIGAAIAAWRISGRYMRIVAGTPDILAPDVKTSG